MSEIERFLQEEHERTQKRKALIQVLIKERDEALSEFQRKLRALGHESGHTEKRRNQKSKGPCRVCGFATEPYHDARAHRDQGKYKKPLTDQELGDRNLRRL